MEKSFILNPALTSFNIKDAIDERLSKLKGVLNCLMFAVAYAQGDDEFDNDSAYHVLWTIDGFLDEIGSLKQKLDEMVH